MKTTTTIRSLRALALAGAALAALVLASGCDRTSPSETPPDAEMAASFAASAQSAATVNENLQLAELFADPMGAATADLGLTEDPNFDPWTGDGVDFPQLVVINAEVYRAIRDLQQPLAADVATSKRATADLPNIADGNPFDRAEGDTLFVEYFDAADSTGVNAVIEAAGVNMVRFVSIRDYPNAVLFQPSHRESELLIDTNGTLEDDSDDSYYSMHLSETLANGQMSTGDIAPYGGEGPITPTTVVETTLRIDQPMFHPLQSWLETRVDMELGDLGADGDETFYRFQNTVHWVNDAEQVAVIEPVDEGPIVDDAEVTLSATFTADPNNPWLESVLDTIRVNMGQLDDDNDDLLLELARTSTFDGVTQDGGSPRAIVSFVPENPIQAGQEPCGGNFEQEIFYAAGWWVQHAYRQVEIACAGGGSAHLHLDFADGSSLDRVITWDAGVATLTESRPDGVTVTGTFNENTGEYSVLTTFAAGSDPESREQSGTMLPGSATCRDEFFWADEHPDYTTFTATENGDSWTVTGQNVDGALAENFSLNGTPDELVGDWSRQDEGVDASGHYTLTALDAGGAHLVFDAQDTLAEGGPSVEGDFWYAPDGSGHGTLAYTQFGRTTVFNVTWDGNGEGQLSDGAGNTAPLG